MIKELTKHRRPKECATRERYENTDPKFLGDLHERMQFVMMVARKNNTEKADHELWTAICDLRTEVSYTTPAKPPYGRRARSTKEII